MSKPWQEVFVDKMGLIVCLDGPPRFDKMAELKAEIKTLPPDKQAEIKEVLRKRFTPTNGADGCQGGTASVMEATA